MLLATAVLPPLAHAQQGGAAGDLPRDVEAAWVALLDPCSGVSGALYDLGYNPAATSALGIRRVRERAWLLLLPVLVDAVDDSALAADPGALRTRIQRQVRDALNGGAGMYSYEQAQQAIRHLDEVGTAARAAADRGEMVLLNGVLAAAVVGNPSMSQAWRAAASVQSTTFGWPAQNVRQLDDQLRGEFGRAASLVLC